MACQGCAQIRTDLASAIRRGDVPATIKAASAGARKIVLRKPAVTKNISRRR